MNTTFLKKLRLKKQNPGTFTGLKAIDGKGEYLTSQSPVDGKVIGSVKTTTKADYEKVIRQAEKAFKVWREIPAPKRGEVVRQYGEALRANKDALGRLVSYEMGKSLQEGWGEVQEMIDICDFAVGLSRQLYGLTMHSERPHHRMYEQWHPLGIVGIISAFNFPVAVWAWNSMIALICGDVCVWKGSEKTPLCTVACHNILLDVLKANKVPEGVSSIVTGDYKVGEYMSQDRRIPLVSATGSSRMGKIVGATVAERLGRSLLELGGNNAIIITPEADLNLVLSGAVFGAVGTCGQRCTSTRRLIVHEKMYNKVKAILTKAYGQLKIGDPLDAKKHVGPLIDKDAVEKYLETISKVKEEGGQFLIEGKVLKGKAYSSGCYVQPCVAEVSPSFKIVQHETFAPILYIMKYKGGLQNAIKIQNNVPQGLSSAIMTTNMREAELFLSTAGSDCGIANVNIGTSWKAYMRRQTNTINYSKEIPLAQGIEFKL